MKSPSFGSNSFPPRAWRGIAAVFIAFAALCASARADAQPELVVRYPSEGAQLPAVAASYTFGAAPPGARVWVNGIAAWTAPDGGWSAFVPLHPGRCSLRVVARFGDTQATALRSVEVDTGAVAPFPNATTIVQPGEGVRLMVSAPPGALVTARGPGFNGVVLSPAPSLGWEAYATKIAAPLVASRPGPVTYRIETRGEISERSSRGMFAVSARPVLFAGSIVPYEPDPLSGARPYAMLDSAPDGATDFMLPAGTEVNVTGRFGDVLRVSLPGQPPEFVDAHQVSPLRGVPAIPPARLESIERSESSLATTIRLRFASTRPAFHVRELTGASGTIRVFGVGAGLGYADYPFTLRQHAFWGYRASWQGSTLDVTFRRPPVFAAPPHGALDGLRVVVDPGHSPDTGAIGPLGTEERDVNLDIALRLAQRLRSQGARVTLTRTSNVPVLLYARPALAERLDADVLISVHNNANPDGVDPSVSHGYEIYFFQPHSEALARSLHAAYQRDVDIRDNGLHTGDFALVRVSDVPAVLTESAYVTWPWEEMRLRDPSFRERLAKAMSDGLASWAERMRTLESGMPSASSAR